jgi:hypothetical protein
MHKILLEKRNEILAYATTLGITEIYVAKADNDTSVNSIAALINFTIPPIYNGQPEICAQYAQTVITEFSNTINALFNPRSGEITVHHKALIELLLQTAPADHRSNVFQTMLLTSISLSVIEDKDLFQQFAEREQRLATRTYPHTFQSTSASTSASTPMPPPSSLHANKKRREGKREYERSDERQVENDSTIARRTKTQPKAPSPQTNVPAAASVSFWQPRTRSTSFSAEAESSSNDNIIPNPLDPIRILPQFTQNPFSPGDVASSLSSPAGQAVRFDKPPSVTPSSYSHSQATLIKNPKIKALLLAIQCHTNKNIWTELTKRTAITLQELQTRLHALSEPNTSQPVVAEINMTSVNPKSPDIIIIDSIIDILKRDPELWGQAKQNPNQIVMQLQTEIYNAQPLTNRFQQLSL